MIASHSATVDGPIFSAAASRRAGVQKAYRRCALGMCSGIVVWRRCTRRACVAGDAGAAMEHLDGSSVIRTSTTWRIRRDGTE